MDYQIVEGSNVYLLAQEVNKMISEGYEVSGSMVSADSSFGVMFYQPMVKSKGSKMVNFLKE